MGGVELRLRAGDAVFLHPRLAYDEAPNGTPDIAYSVCYRADRRDRAALAGFGSRDRLFSGFDRLNSEFAAPGASNVESAASSFDELAVDHRSPGGSFAMD